jgi:hypothetical protein
MNNFSRYDVNVPDMMEDLFIGPQGEVLEQIERFNDNYARNGNNIGITKQFRWKPGTYDNVKSILSDYWIGWNRKPRGMNSLFSHESHYRKSRLQDELIDIETKLARLRWDGQTFLDDTTQITEIFNLFKNKINEGTEQLCKIFPDTSVVVNNEDAAFRSHDLCVTIPVEDVKLNISVGDQESTRHLGMVDYGMVFIKMTINLVGFFNKIYRCLERGREFNGSMNHGRSLLIRGKIFPTITGTTHPYISQSYNYDSSWQNVCTGHLQKDINHAFLNIEWAPMALLIDQWLSNYKIGITGPLNSINGSFMGRPKYLNNEDFFDVVGNQSPSNCWDRQERYLHNADDIVEQCDKVECLLRSECNRYREYSIDQNVFKEMHEYITEGKWKFDILLPSQMEDANYVHWLVWKFRGEFRVNVGASKIEDMWRHIYSAIENKEWPIARDMVLYMHELDVIETIQHDNEQEHFARYDWMHKLLKCKTHEELLDYTKARYEEQRAREDADFEVVDDMVTDEQEQMIMWAESQRS